MKDSDSVIRLDEFNGFLTSARLFASHYQMMITDDPRAEITDELNWDDKQVKAGFAGSNNALMVGTEADLNDHWITVYGITETCSFQDYQRVLSLHFVSNTGKIFIMSVIDFEPTISIECLPGDYTIYVCAKNLGVDQLSLEEEGELTDSDLQKRLDLERYDIYIKPGQPEKTGKIKDLYCGNSI